MKKIMGAMAGLALFFFLGAVCAASDKVYPVTSHLNLRSQPTTKSRVMGKIPLGMWVEVKEKQKDWLKVELPSGKTGFVYKKLVTDIWVKVWKKERKILLLSGNKMLKKWPLALGFNPTDDKARQGDGCTPEGRFYICEMLEKPKPKTKYGARSMRLSYPTREDARRGLKDDIISRAEYLSIVRKINKGDIPPQNTKLGGSIRIHGGGTGSDWTLGCIAMKDKDIIDLYSKLPSGSALVEVYKSKARDEKLNKKGFMNERILAGAKEVMSKGCKYTKDATGIIRIDYPMGDFNPKIGVCTDFVIRSLRKAGIDLQALLYEDILLSKGRYPNISRANTNIDHRRTRNLKIWFDHHALKLTNDVPSLAPGEWLAGDIVLMDTGVQNGTVYDHIGIVSDARFNDRPLVINLWTIGYDIEEMDLLSGDYPGIVGHYRLFHSFYCNNREK